MAHICQETTPYISQKMILGTMIAYKHIKKNSDAVPLLMTKST
jgi:hypothetical protein